jgi:hypothetical protein
MSEQVRRVRVVGELRRPTALVLGEWSEDVLVSLKNRFPVYWTAQDFPSGLSDEDVDYVIVGPDSEQRLFINYLHRCRLIMLENWPDPITQLGFRIAEPTARHRAIIPDLHPLLNKVLDEEVAGTSDFSQWPQMEEDTRYISQSSIDLHKHAVLTSESSAILGFVSNPTISTFRILSSFSNQKYRACLPWKVKNPIGCINAIIEYWAVTIPKDHPFHIPWGAQRDWMTPAERIEFDELARLDEEENRVLSMIQAERAKVRQHLIEHRMAADRGIKKLLTAQNDDLVDITIHELKRLNFSVQNRDESAPAGQRVEDLCISHSDLNGEVILCEVKGFSRAGGKLSDIGKLRRHINRFNRENGKPPYRSWFVVNGQYELPPGQRQAPFQSDRDAVRSLEEEEILVIGTCDLYRLLIDDTLTPDERRQHLLAKEGGVFRWPPPK